MKFFLTEEGFYVDNTELQRLLQCNYSKTVLQTKYVTDFNYKNKNMCFNLTYRQNFSCCFAKS